VLRILAGNARRRARVLVTVEKSTGQANWRKRRECGLVVASLAHRREGDTREKNGLQPSSGLRRRGGGRHAPEDVVAPTQGDTGAGAAAVGKEETDTWRGVA
jgi:hypothetical protein